MSKLIILFIPLIFLITSFMLLQSNDDEDIIIWRANRKLTWNDFKGQIPNNPEDAVAAVDVEINFNSINETVKGDSAIFVVTSIVYTNSSWYRKDVILSEATLKHEQGHFDIEEILARQVRKELMGLNLYAKTADKQYDVMIKKYLELEKKEQKLYDAETGKGGEEKQNVWNKKIEQELKELDAYKKYKIVVAYQKTN